MYELNGLEALGNKASPRERCPRGQRPVPRTGQCRHGWTQEKKQPGMGPQNPRKKRATSAGKSGPTVDKKSTANCRRTEGSQPSVKQTTNNHHSCRDPQTQITQQDGRDADGSDSAQRSEAQQPQFIEETIEIPVSAQRQTGFSRSWRLLHYSAMMRRLSSGPQCSEDCGDVAG